jgi:hypothetical protein
MLLLLSGSVHPNPGPRNTCMSIAHLNAISLNIVDKFSEISAIAELHKFGLLAFSETWLNSTISNESILMTGFSAPLRKDRISSRGGGVSLYVADHLPFVRLLDLESPFTELLWAEIAVNRVKILCGVCYRPPSQISDQLDLFLNYLQASLDSINMSNNFSTIIILGDFNAHFYFAGASSLNTDVGVKLYNFLEGNNLFQLIEEPTRVTLTGKTILDLIITDSPGYFISTGTLSPPSNCDHNIVYANLNISSRKQRSFKRTVRNYKNANVNALNAALLNVNWGDVFSNPSDSIDVVYNKWFNLFNSILDAYIPSREITVRPEDKPWMNGSIRQAIRRRDRLLKRFSNIKSVLSWERYRTQRYLVVKLIRRAKMEHQRKINTLLADPTTSAKKWWGISKSLY